jgi:hypothetical protein
MNRFTFFYRNTNIKARGVEFTEKPPEHRESRGVQSYEGCTVPLYHQGVQEAACRYIPLGEG